MVIFVRHASHFHLLEYGEWGNWSVCQGDCAWNNETRKRKCFEGKKETDVAECAELGVHEENRTCYHTNRPCLSKFSSF